MQCGRLQTRIAVTKNTQIAYMKVHEEIYMAYIPTLAVLPYNTMI